jgi:hypothetical protein
VRASRLLPLLLILLAACSQQAPEAGVESRLRQEGPSAALYAEYLPGIGPDGILDAIEAVWPRCHSEAHDLGKAIYGRAKDIGEALRACGARCQSGCMHGVLMQAYPAAQAPGDPEGHASLARLTAAADGLCRSPLMAGHLPGSCAHGVGHAAMMLSGYAIPAALAACDAFGHHALRYYCATGAYMEHATARAIPEDPLASCEGAPVPVACMRYAMRHATARAYAEGRPLADIIRACGGLSGGRRLGCHHGIGNAHAEAILEGTVMLGAACGQGTDLERRLCIEGAIEHIARYDAARALALCAELAGADRDACQAAAAHGLYSLERDLTAYRTP